MHYDIRKNCGKKSGQVQRTGIWYRPLHKLNFMKGKLLPLAGCRGAFAVKKTEEGFSHFRSTRRRKWRGKKMEEMAFAGPFSWHGFVEGGGFPIAISVI